MSYFAPSLVTAKRLEECLKCERLTKLTKQCKECGCFMVLKTKIANSECPLKKWKKYKTNN